VARQKVELDGKVAFETVPLVREILAIRLAMHRVYHSYPSAAQKPWWISTI
jgi:hypothetical protein